MNEPCVVPPTPGEPDCFTEDTLVDFLAGRADVQGERIAAHVDDCTSCRRLMIALAKSNQSRTLLQDTLEQTSPALLGSGTVWGRYTILRLIGAGGMGVVYAALDPALDRTVALKLVRPEFAQSSEIKARLIRESKAMARISHPNVAIVYDVGEVEGQCFIAMEWIDGETLAAWLQREPRSWKQVLDVFSKAGEGLASAHHAGLVHRDFKPENVLVDRSNRVRVTDFGLVHPVRTDTSFDPSANEVDHAHVPHGASASVLTNPGIVVGTPAYMAPEHNQRGHTDARSDQFSFCVALFEGLYGKRPFTGRTLEDIAHSIATGNVRFPTQPRIPRWLRHALVRGLAVEPEQRFPSMEALLRALALQRRPVLYWTGWAGIGLACFAVLLGLRRTSDEHHCGRGATELAGIWDAERKAAVRQAVAKDDTPQSVWRWTYLEAELDAFAKTWVDSYRDHCEKTKRGEQSAELADLQTHCLNSRQDRLRHLTALLVAEDPIVIEGALDAIRGVGRLEPCSAVEVLEARIPIPADLATRTQVESIRRELVRAEVLEKAGQYKDAIPVVDRLVSEATRLGYRPIEAEALYRRGTVQTFMGEYAAAEQSLRDAAFAAESGRHDVYAAEAWISLIGLASHDLGVLERAYEYAKHARAAIDRLGYDPTREAVYNFQMAKIYRLDSQPQKQSEAVRRTIELIDELDDEFEAIRILEGIGFEYADQGEFQKALGVLEQVLDRRSRTLGPEHPDVGLSHNNVSIALDMLGDTAGALEHARLALSIFETSLDPYNVQVGIIIRNIAGILSADGRDAETLVTCERAREILIRHYPETHPHIVALLRFQGVSYIGLGEPARGLELLQKVLTIVETTRGHDSAQTGEANYDVALALREVGKLGESLEHDREALRILTEIRGSEHISLVNPLTGMGIALVKLGRPVEALEPLRRAQALYKDGEVDAKAAIGTDFTLAQALFEIDRNQSDALALARDARERFAAAGPAFAKDLAEVDGWLATAVARRDDLTAIPVR